MTYTEEEKRATARKALDWCAERHGTLSAFAREQGRDLETLKRWVQRYYPDELAKYSNGKVRQRQGHGARGFVPVTAGEEGAAKDNSFRIRYCGAEVETDEQGLGAVLRTVLALSRSAR